MTAQIENVRPISPSQLSQFLLREGWLRSKHPNDRLIVFSGPNDDAGSPLEVAIPKSATYRDFGLRVSEIVASLAVVLGQTAEELARRISRINRDVLCSKIVPPKDTELNSIGLSAAAEYIHDLRTLMSYAATTEDNPRAYFGKAGTLGTEFASECRFGHTFRGSFGFVVETAPLPEVSNAAPIHNFSRRVMERLATGFDHVRRGVEADDITVVSNNYKEGLNANMCETVVKMSGLISRTATQFDVAFGGAEEPQLRSAITPSPLLLSDRTVEYLESAAQTLRASARAQRRTYRGKIVELKSNVALVDDADLTDHTAIMRTSSGTRLRLRLSISDYLIACEAHIQKRDVQIDGIAEKVGKRWNLTEAGSLTMPA